MRSKLRAKPVVDSRLAWRPRTSIPDVVLMDLSMPDLSGFDAMERMHEHQPSLPVVILTADADPEVEAEARRAGASGFVAKGTRLDDIVIVLHEAADRSSRPRSLERAVLVGVRLLHFPEPPAELLEQRAGELGELIHAGH